MNAIHVLLIDDDQDEQVLFKRLLDEIPQSQYVLQWQSNYQSALAALEKAEFDICFIDYHLGQHTGIDLLVEAQKTKILKPCVLLTGVGDYTVDVAAMKAGAFDYLYKHELSSQVLERVIRYAIWHTEDYRQLKLREENFTTMFDSAPEAVLILDGYTVEDANASTVRMFGVAGKDDLLGQPLAKFFTAFDNLAVDAMSSEKNGYETERKARRHDGKRMDLLCITRPILLHGQNRILLRVQDITEKKKLQTRSNLIEKVRTRAQAAQAANTAKSQFLSNMSHEIRTPLGSVMGFIDLALDPAVAEKEKHKCLLTAKRSAEHLLTLVNDILDLSKVEANHLEIEYRKFNLREFLDEVSSIMSHKAHQKNLAFSIHSLNHLPLLIGMDSLRLRQILINLIGNSIKFTAKGNVDVSVEYKTSKKFPHALLEFKITDTGIGLSAEEQKKLFRPFSQSRASTARHYGGTGLGLVLSKKLAQLMKGDLVLENSLPEKGSTFKLQVPISGSHSTFSYSSQTPMDTDTPLADVQRIPDLNGKKILLIEDSVENQILVSAQLKKTGITLEIAGGGAIGIQKALASQFDLVLLDIQMPIVDGYQVMKQLKAVNYSKPIIALTAQALRGEKVKALAAGFTEYLTKPINKHLLYETLEYYLKNGINDRNAPLQQPI